MEVQWLAFALFTKFLELLSCSFRVRPRPVQESFSGEGAQSITLKVAGVMAAMSMSGVLLGFRRRAIFFKNISWKLPLHGENIYFSIMGKCFYISKVALEMTFE